MTQLIKTLDSTVFATGIAEGLQTKDPAGKLSLGLRSLPPAILGNYTSVVCRTTEGSGTILANEGLGASGTKVAGTWAVSEDGHAFIQSPSISFPHHSSMVSTTQVGDEVKPTGNLSGMLYTRLSGASTLFSKSGAVDFSFNSNRSFTIGRWQDTITAAPAGKKSAGGVLHSLVEIFQTSQADAFIPDGDFHWIGFSISGSGAWSVMVDNGLVAQFAVTMTPANDPGNILYIGPIIGDVDQIVFTGTTINTSISSLLNPTGGTLATTVIDLLDSYYFDRALMNNMVLPTDTSIGLALQLSESSAVSPLRYQKAELTMRDLSPAPTPSIYYPSDLAKGRYLVATIKMNRPKPTALSPSLTSIDLRFHKN